MSATIAAEREYKPCSSFDIPVKVAKDMNVGEKVRVTISGVVKSVEMREPDEYNPEGGYLRVELEGSPKVTKDGSFEDLADDEDGDSDE